jgi:hypothetical protein
MTPTSQASGLSRRSTGVSEAQRELIRLLAEVAVAQYIQETESTAAPAEPQEASR